MVRNRVFLEPLLLRRLSRPAIAAWLRQPGDLVSPFLAERREWLPDHQQLQGKQIAPWQRILISFFVDANTVHKVLTILSSHQ